mgnify:CR=1 FL=1
MATYSSKPVVIARNAEELASRFGDFTILQERLDAMPEEQRQAVGNVSFTADTITINTPQMGAINLRAVERTPEAIVLQAEGSPVPMQLKVTFKAVSAESTEVCGVIDVDIPAIIKPMVGPTLQKAADKFGELFSGLA